MFYIICGRDNKYGHPAKETTATLNKYKITPYRTDINGTVKATSDAKNITVTTENKTTDKVNSSATNNSVTTNNTVRKQDTSTTQPITKTGKKYHKDGRSSLSKSKNAISLEDVKTKGYEVCSNFNP